MSIDGEDFYQWKTVLRIPKNWTPESGVFIAVAPPGGIANFPAAVQGDPGLPIVIRNSTVVPLEATDSTPDSFTWTLVTPGSATVQPVYDVTLAIHKGAKGDDGTMVIGTATDFDRGTTDANMHDGYILQLKSDGSGGFKVTPVALRVGNTYWPTAITTLSNATGGNAIATIVIPPQLFPFRLHVNGQDIVSYDGTDVQVDLVARLGGTGTCDGHTDGQVIARGLGLPGSAALMQVLDFAAAPPVNSTTGFGQVAAGGSGTSVFIRMEQVGSGTSTFDTIAGRGIYSVDVIPVG